MILICRVSLAAVVGLALAVPAVASASTVTVGSPLTASFAGNNLYCGPCTEFNATLGESGASATSPVSGTIVQWRISGNASGGAFKLRVLEPAASGEFTGAGSSSPMVPAGTGVSTFSTQLPIKAGDAIGLDLPDAVWDDAYTTSVVGSSSAGWSPALADGTTSSPNHHSNSELGFNADVVPQPSITALGPASGPSSGGTRVVIAGSDFSGATAVSFGSRQAASFTVNSDGAITAVSPSALKGTVDITVTAVGGTSSTSTTDRFTYTNSGCTVPRIKGDALEKARKALHRAHCELGIVAKPMRHNGKLVVKAQSPMAGTVLAKGSGVSVKLRSKPHHEKD